MSTGEPAAKSSSTPANPSLALVAPLRRVGISFPGKRLDEKIGFAQVSARDAQRKTPGAPRRPEEPPHEALAHYQEFEVGARA
jgi:hypothetical protein